MKKLEITTGQNVTIQFELATVMERVGAYIIDLVAMGLIILILSLVVGIFSTSEEAIVYIAVLPVYFFYHLLMEVLFNGQSIGKLLLGLKVVRIDGEKPSFFDYTMRWSFRSVDFTATAFLLAPLLISSSSKNQRLGDFFANTIVVKLGGGRRLRLNKVLQLDELREYDPVYPQVTMFTEEEMLLIKEMLERSRKYNNKAHKEAFRALLKRIQNTLGVEIKGNPRKFLLTLIKDYVTLTR